MARKKFYFNPETIDYEEIQITFSKRLRQVLFHTLSGILLGIAFFFLFVSIIKSPKEKELAQEKSRIEGQYKALKGQIKEMQAILSDIEERDNNLYRVVLQAEPIPADARRAAGGNIEYYERLMKMTNSEIVIETSKQFNELRKQLYVQSRSFDEIVSLVKNHGKMLECIPAIQPVLNKDLTRVASGWGYRIDPIYRTQKFHYGMDFTAPTGTEIFATGKGIVTKVGWEQGYGNSIKINHGYGYETFYAHLSDFNVKMGQTVIRGEVIGYVGNTGKSTGPHLHYEVHQKGVPVNPQNFYSLDLTPEEYDRMVQLSENYGQTLD